MYCRELAVTSELQNLIFQCALKEAGAIDPVISLLETERERGISEDIDLLIHRILDHNVPLDHGSELAWALWAAVWFKRPVTRHLAERLDGNPDPIVALLTLHARDISLIESDVEFPMWSSLITRDCLYNAQWLLAYEADFRGWLSSAETSNHVDEDPNFGVLKRLGISFFDPSIAAPTRALLKKEAYEDSYGSVTATTDLF